MTGVGPEVTLAAKAIGLIGSDGNLSPAWFNQPLHAIERLLTNGTQRQSLLDLVDQLFPPETPAGAPANETWHPLLGQQPNGNLYLTIANGSGPATLGIAGLVRSTTSPLPASLRAHLPLVQADDTGVRLIAGQSGAGFECELRLELNWSKASGQAIALAAIRVNLVLTPLAASPTSLQITMEGLSLDGTAPSDAVLDPAALGHEAFTLVVGLIREELRQISATASGESAAVANHLMPLLGLADGFPPFPFASLSSNPSAIRSWFEALVSTGKISDWLGHLGSMFGDGSASAGSGSIDDPWRGRVFQIDANSALDIILTRVVSEHSGVAALDAGLRARYVPAGTNPIARIEASATLARLPLSGLDSPAILPDAAILVVAPGDAANRLIDTATISAASIEAGLRWDGTTVVPALELDDVDLNLGATTPTHYDRIDLTNTGSVIADASAAVRDTIVSGLGTGIGQHLAALAGLAKPSGDSGWNHATDLPALVSHPTQAIAAVHRAALVDPVHSWSFLFAEAAALLGLGGGVQGSGQRNDPWRVSISPGTISMELAAWNAQESGNTGDPQQLRIGLRASVESAPWHAWWLAELLAVGLPASGSGTMALMAGQHAQFLVQPVPSVPEAAGFSIGADSVGLSLDWIPGGDVNGRAVVTNLSVTAAGSTLTIPTLTFPTPASFDLANPGAALGISSVELETLFRLMFTRGLLSWAGPEGLAVSALLGLNGALPGLQSDWPLVSGDVFGDPLASLRAWLKQVTLTVSSDGSPFLPNALAWLSGWLNDGLPGLDVGPPPETVAGSGSYEDPWAMNVVGGIEWLAWLEPSGPPVNWLSGAAGTIQGTETYYELLSAFAPLRPFQAGIREGIAYQDLPVVADLLDELDSWLATTDGFVPLDSQIPKGGMWTAGTPIQSAHTRQPSDPAAIAQIQSQIAAWNPADKVVLLAGPAFSDHSIWSDLLTAVPLTPNFNFRLDGVDPANVDVSGVTETSDFYTADFQDNGVDGVTAQLARVVARIGELRPGTPVTLVAHSTAGLAACAFAKANSAALRGVIAIGSPLQGTPFSPLRDPAIANTLRVIEDLTLDLAAGPLRDAVGDLIQAMDGYVPAPAKGQLPVPRPFPLNSFPATGSSDTGTVPAFAIGGALPGSLFDHMLQAAVTLATNAAGVSVPAPTHVGFGVRAHLDFGASGTVHTDVTLRADAGRVALASGEADPPRPAHSYSIAIALSSGSGWLAGSAQSDVRVRWAEFGLTVSPAGTLPLVRLHGTAFHSPSLGQVDFAHPEAQPLIGAIFHAASDLGAGAGAAFTAAMTALTAIGVVTSDAHGGFGISSDAWTALKADPAGYLKPRINTALAQGIAGFTTAQDGSSVLEVGGTPLQIYSKNGTLGVRSTAPLSLASITLTADARVDLASFTPSLDFGFTFGAFMLSVTGGRVTVSAPPWLPSLSLLPPPSASELDTALTRAVPRLLLSSAASAVLEAALGSDIRVAAIDPILESFGTHLISADALGNGDAFDPAKVSDLLHAIAELAGLPAGPGLALPGNLALTASGTDVLELTLATTAPLGGVADVQLSASIDRARSVSPSGTLALHVGPLGNWDSITIAFGVDRGGVSLSLAPQATPPIAPIQLLPTFSGLGSLAGAAARALLPAALDALADAAGPSTVRDQALAVAHALDLYDPANKFAGHSAQLAALIQGNWAASINAGMQGAVIPNLRDLLGSVNASVGISGNAVTIGAASEFSVALGWDTGPTVALHTNALKAAGGAVTADIDLGVIGGKVTASVTLGLHLQSSIGVPVIPALTFDYNGTALAVRLLPLGAANASTLAISLAPTVGVQPGPDLAGSLARNWLLPVTADLLVGAATPHFDLAVWSGGPTVRSLLTDAALIDTAGHLAVPLPDAGTLSLSLLTSFAKAAELTVDTFTLKFVKDAHGLGVIVRGSHDLSLGSIDLTVHLENTDFPTASPGVTLYIFDAGLNFAPRLSVAGLGASLSGPGGGPLVNNSGVRLEDIGGFLYFDFDGHLSNLGGVLDAHGLGLPLGQLGGTHDGGNPVASSLLEGAGSGTQTSGDPNPVNPAIDVIVAYVGGAFSIQLGSPNPPLWIGVHRSFGPIYIEQIGLNWTNTAADLLVDGSVKVSALTVQAYELGLKIGFADLLAPEHWKLDLKGLAVGFQSGNVSISGGLIKNPGPPIEYDGMLSADIAGRGFTVVGGYARPVDSLGSYTSLFIFVALPIPIGGPPFLFVTGLGAGAGYNRRLIPPTDFNQIPNFFLVSAIDDDSLANNPMGALVSMGQSSPPHRGGFWLAAGVRFNSFVVVNTIAVVYVALDRGFEVGILGVSRLQLPPASDVELVNIELALKARYSTADAILSIQAQLTSNSWIFSHDCQLTGGFAFFIWFREGHFVLTIGGYHPAFQKPPEFPDVPRLGFHWQVLDDVQIKGESYFALTSSAFMAGGRLDASAGFDGIRAWFTVHLDVLIQWDPFHYDFLGGIQVGVSLKIEVCFFGACASVHITISRGADIHIFGPPFHADLTFDAYVTSITLSFGGDPHPQSDPLPWAAFRDKYLIAGNPENTWVGARVIAGLLPPESPGAQPSPGTQASPWTLTPEFAFLTESRMPVSGYAVTATALDQTGAVIPIVMKSKTDGHLFDLAPMQKLKVGSAHAITFTPAVTHPDQFLVEEILDLVPEAPWHWYDPSHLPAAANRINAITGLRVTAVAVLQGRSALIPIATLVDDDPRFARPLPFATDTTALGTLQTAGLTAESLALLATQTGTAQTLSAVAAMLTGAGFFADARRTSGLPAAGLSPLAAHALATRRSSPPSLTPLSTGLSMKAVGLAAPPQLTRPAAIGAILLQQPRLRAVLQSRILPAADAPPVVRTTVTRVLSAGAARLSPPRMSPPKPDVVAGAKLHRVSAPQAPAPTAASMAPRSLRTAQTAALTSARVEADFEAAIKAFVGDGVVVPAGTTHLWDIPSDGFSVSLTEAAMARVTFMDRAGSILQDVEVISPANVTAPPGCELLAVACLGAPGATGLKIQPGFGAVSSMMAPTGGLSAVGWQSDNVFPQIGATSILARGSAILLRQFHFGSLKDQRITQAMTHVSDALASQSGVETQLPKSIAVVMILLDQQDPSAAGAGDIAIACEGATLATPPIVGAGGRRSALLYDVISADPKSAHLGISVGSKAGWTLSGVVGLPGKAAEWAARLNGTVPPHLVPDGPLTPGGEIRARLTKPSEGVS